MNNQIVKNSPTFAIGKHRNAISGRFYTWAQNQLRLEEAGYKTPSRLTWNQMKLAGLSLKSGAKWQVIYYTEIKQVEERTDDGQVVKKAKPHNIKHVVFNLEDTIKSS